MSVDVKTPTTAQVVTDEDHTFIKALRLMSWNIDRMNESKFTTITNILLKDSPAVFCINEIKMSAKKLITEYLQQIKGYKYVVNDHSPGQYHGVAMLIRNDIQYKEIPVILDCKSRRDSKDVNPARGRVIAVEIEIKNRAKSEVSKAAIGNIITSRINVVSCYTPNAGTALKYLGYRTEAWDPAFHKFLDTLRSKSPTVWLGDINVAPDLIDVSHPQEMKMWPGFTDEERKSHKDFLKDGEWIDIWRNTHPNEMKYTWLGAKCGMRLDAVIISKDLINNTKSVGIMDIHGSDHLGLKIDLGI